jgi:signal transduction histidine kinase
MMVVALLGYQQYRWISRVAEVEAQTSRQKLDASLKAFADDFDTEITRTNLAFIGLVAQSRSDVLSKARERLHVFQELSDYPALIGSIDVEEGLPDPYTINPGPPPSLTVPAFVREANSSKRRSKPGASFSLQLATGMRFETGTGVGMQLGSIPLRIRIIIDQKYIVSSLLPRMLEHHLGLSAEHYDVLIRSAKANSLVLQWGAESKRPWESARRIFAIRPDCLVGKADRTSVTTVGPFTQDMASLLRKSESCGDTPNPVSGLWIVNIRAQPSLSETVDSAKRQNVAISFGVMLVLAMAIGILFVSARRARELAALHEQFAAGVSHELRTPLSVISSASENLADGVVENADQMRRYGKMIRAHSEQLSEMVENALWFARREARHEMEVGEVDVEELVSTAAGTCSRMLQESGVVLERDLEPGLPTIRGNRTLLLHGLQNLLSNVARYGRSGKWARIRAERVRSEVVFTVEDHGDGIPPEEVARVFEPFYRGKRAKQTNLAGLGLGLSLVRRIVEAHAGKIQLRPEHNLGTTITFTIPICDQEESNLHLEEGPCEPLA